MPYFIDTLPDLGVIRVSFLGAIALRDRSSALDEVIRRLGAADCRRLLVDLTRAKAQDDCPTRATAHASRMAREPALRDVRIAYVGDTGCDVAPEGLAALRGFFCQRFRTQGSALVWLCGERALEHAA